MSNLDLGSQLSYFNHEKVSIDNSLWISIDTPFKISIDKAIAASIDISSRKLYRQVWFMFSNSLDQLSSVSSQLDHSSYFQVLGQAMAWSQLILRSKFKGWSILNLALSTTRWMNYISKQPNNCCVSITFINPFEKPKSNSKDYSDIFMKLIVMMVWIILR